ncbi:MAG TPA: reverse transcriptase domain-containing protein [Polyangiaceae bacterium]|nr:reverse transcriptase domain-containing protein [Polyangiaceae bacterium]
MATRPRTRQELYDRIAQTSKDEVILDDMVRLGFWPGRGLPGDPSDEFRREGELRRELAELRADLAKVTNVERARKQLLEERLAASRKARQETKQRRLAEAKARAEAWREKKATEIVYLGERVSGGLTGGAPADPAKLSALGLPHLDAPPALAAALGLSVGALRALAFHRPVSESSSYVRFTIPKKAGGTRLISAPMPRLKAAQRWVLERLLAPLAAHEAAHGFRRGRSIVSNAAPHVGAKVVINVDLKDFFPSVTYRRVKGVFRSHGHAESVATALALLCTEPEVEAVELDGRRYFVALGERRLPQGAPTSPALTNLLCRRLDRRLEAASAKFGFVYTRYADDLSLSSPDPARGATAKMLNVLRAVIASEGFELHPDKTRVLRRGRRQEVTGLTVNRSLGVERAELRRFRALLHQLDVKGPEGLRWGQSNDVFAAALGFANYVAMVQPEKGAALRQRVRELMAKHAYRPPPRPARGKRAAATTAPAAGAPPAALATGAPPAAPATGAPPAAPGAKAPDPPDAPADPSAPKKKWWKLF